jgi:hypothetical protein
MVKEKGDEIIGKRVRVKTCEARNHGNNSGCVCGLIGEIVTIGKKYDTHGFCGVPSYHIKGSDKTVRRGEVVLLRVKNGPVEEILSKCKTTGDALSAEVDFEAYPDAGDQVIACAVMLAQTPVDAMLIFRSGSLQDYDRDTAFEKALLLCVNGEDLAEIMEYFCDSGFFALDSEAYITKIFERKHELA